MHCYELKEVLNLLMEVGADTDNLVDRFLKLAWTSACSTDDVDEASEIASLMISFGGFDKACTVALRSMAEADGKDEADVYDIAKLLDIMPAKYATPTISLAFRNESRASEKISLHSLLREYSVCYAKGTGGCEEKIDALLRRLREINDIDLSMEKRRAAVLEDQINQSITVGDVFEKLRTPISELEKSVAIAFHNHTENAQSLLDVARKLREGIEDLYGIGSVLPVESLQNQEPVTWDENDHLLQDDLPKDGPVYVHIDGLGFILPASNGAVERIKAHVSLSPMKSMLSSDEVRTEEIIKTGNPAQEELKSDTDKTEEAGSLKPSKAAAEDSANFKEKPGKKGKKSKKKTKGDSDGRAKAKESAADTASLGGQL